MKRIKFNELGFKKNFDTVIVVFGFLVVIFGLIGFFFYKKYNLVFLVGMSALLSNYPYLKMFFYENYFFWTKNGANLKINSSSKEIVFSKVLTYYIEENNLIFKNNNLTTLVFPLRAIHPDDTLKLQGILEKKIKISS